MTELRCPTCAARVPVPAGVDEVTCAACFARIPVDPAGPPAAPPPPTEAAPPGVYPVTPFVVPDGGNPALLLAPLAAGLVGAVFFAVACGIVRGYFWLAVVFPLVHGAAVGFPVGLAARVVRFRRRLLLGTVAAAAAALSVLGTYFLAYLAFAAQPGAPPLSFWEYMDLRATRGVRIGKAGAGGQGANLGYTGTIIYWVIEGVLAGVGAAGVAVAMVTAPFCVGCNAWKRKRTLGPYRVEPGPAVTAVTNGVPAGLVQPAEGIRAVTLTVYSCPHCGEQGTADVHAQGTLTEGKNTWTCQAYVTYPGEALPAIEAAAAACDAQGLKTK